MPVGRNHKDHPGLERLVLGDGLYRHRALAREYLLQVALALGVEVLGHDDGGVEVFGQLGRTLPGESPEELEPIAEEDWRKAEEGLVELRSGNEVWYKHIDELTREDRPGRIESENVRAAWIQERLRRQRRPQ